MKPLKINLDNNDPMTIVFDSPEEYHDYINKVEIITKAQIEGKLNGYDYIDVVNKTMTQKELLFMATMHFMSLINHIKLGDMLK